MIIVAFSGLIGAAASSPDVVQVGTLKLCHPIVKSVSIGSDRYTGEPTLTVILDDQAKTTFAHLTKQAINSFLPVTLNGEVVANPRIQLEITGGEFQISALIVAVQAVPARCRNLPFAQQGPNAAQKDDAETPTIPAS